MGGKGKKKGKKKKGGKKPSAPPKVILPNFVPLHRIKSPLAIKIHHKDDVFLIYSDEYDESSKIFEELSKILEIEPANMRLYFSNKRMIEIDGINHDQRIIHNCHLFLSVKIDDQWENIKDIINYNIYDVNLDGILQKEEEKRLEEERKKKEEEELKKKKELEKTMGKRRKK